MASSEYDDLERATVAFKHLNSNSANHSDPFSAIAEFVDNSYDANSKNLYIDYVERDGYHLLEFLDDGKGMTHEEALNVIAFGHSDKKEQQIGRYGNGLKSGGFHLGRELLLLTKRNRVRTVMLISHQFHEDRKLENSVFVPCPSMDQNGEPYGTEREKNRFELEMKIIHEYAPLGETSLDSLFSKITSESGTLIIISKLKRSAIGEFLINTKTDGDIRLDGDDLPVHRTSLREYLEIIYLFPVMRIHIRGQIVNPRKIYANWMAKYSADIMQKYFKSAFEDFVKMRQIEEENCQESINDKKSEIGALAVKELPQAQYKLDCQVKNQELEQLIKKLDDLKKDTAQIKKDYKFGTVSLSCGIEVENRKNDGIHIYINNRLIQWGCKKGFHKKTGDSAIGISAFLNLDSTFFRPTTNKQGLECAKTFNNLLKKCEEYLQDYFDNYLKFYRATFLRKIKWGCQNDEEAQELFWRAMGYRNPKAVNSGKEEITDAAILKAKKMELGTWFLCQQCRCWKMDKRLITPPSNPTTDICSSRMSVCKPSEARTENYSIFASMNSMDKKTTYEYPAIPKKTEGNRPGNSEVEDPIVARRVVVKQERVEEEEENPAIEDNIVDPMMVEEEQDYGGFDDHEEEQSPRREPREARLAQKSARRTVEEPAGPVNKKRKSVKTPTYRNREEYIEANFNNLLSLLGEPLVPRRGIKKINVEEIYGKIKRREEEAEKKVEKATRMIRIVDKAVNTLLSYLEEECESGLDLPSNGESGLVALRFLENQIREKRRNRQSARSGEPSTSSAGNSATRGGAGPSTSSAGRSSRGGGPSSSSSSSNSRSSRNSNSHGGPSTRRPSTSNRRDSNLETKPIIHSSLHK